MSGGILEICKKDVFFGVLGCMFWMESMDVGLEIFVDGMLRLYCIFCFCVCRDIVISSTVLVE